jgi:hypothetical protein
VVLLLRPLEPRDYSHSLRLVGRREHSLLCTMMYHRKSQNSFGEMGDVFAGDGILDADLYYLSATGFEQQPTAPHPQQRRQLAPWDSVSLSSASPRRTSAVHHGFPTTHSHTNVGDRQVAQPQLIKGKPSKRETLDDIAKRVPLHLMRKYFDVPLRTAASSLNVSVTTLKRLCRRNGVTRWPHRQIHGINRAIELLQSRLMTVKPGCTTVAAAIGDGQDSVEDMKNQLQQLKVRRKNIIKQSAGLKAVRGWLEGDAGELLEDNTPPPPVIEPAALPKASSSSSSTIFGSRGRAMSDDTSSYCVTDSEGSDWNSPLRPDHRHTYEPKGHGGLNPAWLSAVPSMPSVSTTTASMSMSSTTSSNVDHTRFDSLDMDFGFQVDPALLDDMLLLTWNMQLPSQT